MNIQVAPPALPEEPNVELALKDAREQVMQETGAIPTGSWVFAGIVIVLGAVGVYLGRYLRLNSWDVRHPGSLVRKLRTHVRQRGKALEAFGFVLTHALLIALLYVPLFTLAWSTIGADAL